MTGQSDENGRLSPHQQRKVQCRKVPCENENIPVIIGGPGKLSLSIEDSTIDKFQSSPEEFLHTGPNPG
ncbi:hypothetical protein HO173_003181 [Letharia columbiana]|uniref:Uncharacterized protein n=1 Tax=Letharia columbiana TaxID=112416 RepID=A0A8H6G1L9_9LECA|nr:uncharacterized protein HO173_003181 [Letharia columbiana]KAF6238675.1 hypothetical protein HO173_003181 [Letharia columbiana]